MDELKHFENRRQYRLPTQETIIVIVVSAIAIGIGVAAAMLMQSDHPSREESTPQVTQTGPSPEETGPPAVAYPAPKPRTSADSGISQESPGESDPPSSR